MKRNDERKYEVNRFINDFIKEYGVSPSYDEIANSIKCAKSTLFKYKSTPTLFEWNSSPIVYKTTKEWENISAIIDHYFVAKQVFTII